MATAGDTNDVGSDGYRHALSSGNSGEPMVVDNIGVSPSQSSDDLYLSDTDEEFLDAVDETSGDPSTAETSDDMIDALCNSLNEQKDSTVGEECKDPIATSFMKLESEDVEMAGTTWTSQSIDPVSSESPHNMRMTDVSDESAGCEAAAAQKQHEDPCSKSSLDLVDSIKGMYRILDLISEHGSGGLVDKIIIDQNSAGRFINELRPGAYKDLTKVNFKALDDVLVKPLGIYGSKSEIVRFLQSLGVVNDHIAQMLLLPQTEDMPANRPSFRSGLYVLLQQDCKSIDRRLFVIFWPEETTWDDNAISSVRRNRITFMRYLTKITDQIMVLISEEHGKALAWDDSDDVDGDTSPSGILDEDTDRLFAFEVSKSNEQEENATVSKGIKLRNRLIQDAPLPDSETTASSGISASRLKARLVAGDTRQGLLTAEFIPRQTTTRFLRDSFTNKLQSKAFFCAKDVNMQFSKDISHDAICLLVRNGLGDRYPEAVTAFNGRECRNEERIKEERRFRKAKIKEESEATESQLRDALETHLVNQVLAAFPKLDEADLRRKPREQLSPRVEWEKELGFLDHLFCLFPTLKGKLQEVAPANNFTEIKPDNRNDMKKVIRKVFICDDLFWNYPLSDDEQKTVWELVHAGVDSGTLKAAENYLKNDESGLVTTIVRGATKLSRSFLPGTNSSHSHDEPLKSAQRRTNKLTWVDFFVKMDGIADDWPVLRSGIQEAVTMASEYFAKRIADALQRVPPRLTYERIVWCNRVLEGELGGELRKAQAYSRDELLSDIREAENTKVSCIRTVRIDNVERSGYTHFNEQCHITGEQSQRLPPAIRYTVHQIELTQEDRHSLKEDFCFIPKPKIAAEHRNSSFMLTVDMEIKLFRLLPDDACILVVEEANRDLYIYHARTNAVDAALTSKRWKKHINREKTGQDIALSYDEDKHALVICGVDASKPLVQVFQFVFDERYETLQARGGANVLTAWYLPIIPKIIDIHILGNDDEVAILEDTGRLRIFSTVTQQFRPASLQLPFTPLTTFSTPDGSCFGAINGRGDESTLSIFHWASLGTHEGFSFQLPNLFSSPPVVSSFDDKKNVHLLMVDSKRNHCSSIRVEITRPITEFQFREKNSNGERNSEGRRTLHNSLLDCHSDVWTRFPVLPAIKSQVKTLDERRNPRSLCFVTTPDTPIRFKDHFDDMIRKFERSTKKPTGPLLNDIAVHTANFAAVASSLKFGDVHDGCSFYKAGEWIVDIFCLIPIQIAFTRDNRFIPLKDGVWHPEVEKSLLGADVGRVADSLSLGWYESIFESYMSTKIVKVISSMGEQSVGKSYALNHLADTSFAGSAMRTTEGVWMAVTPTESELIVSLDFEGVHSIERSAQEDTLLVLFNAAISNLVLFRNNFALSRDITDLFQSFQSSSSILDPEANPSLFQSTLVIIIKDVVDSDRLEIAKEFKLKLHRIVQEEQASNFISRLYRGRLNIIPWPVIESRQFYTLFTTLKKHLDGQASSHEGGRAFLNKIKMLMAKLKTNDWGSLSQNLATHRAQHLIILLPRALVYGALEVEPEIEPLKNFDSNEVIEIDDSGAALSLGDPTDQNTRHQGQATLHRLIRDWHQFGTRQRRPDSEWAEQLSLYLRKLVDQRVAHVQAWVDSNLSGFNTSNAAIDELRKALDSGVVELRRSVQLCKTRCDRCHLFCMKAQFHEDVHDCSTDHTCLHGCQFTDDHLDSSVACTLLAGHEGVHICDPSAHLCGRTCGLSSKKGCQGSCTRVANHAEEDHICSSKRHLCGELCELRSVRSSDGKQYDCPGTCSALWDEVHEQHICDAASCPFSCQLCKRLCSSPNHLHGLEDSVVHLCGQEHRCAEPCSSKGVCEIDTVPQSVEATFSGSHDRFQYTKYSQAAKRLQCAVSIAPGLLSHEGLHIHTTASNPFHYCDARCGNCGYVCTLPAGHSQPEHSTNHGSMTRTRWAVDGPDGSAVELDGHRFGASDDGAPMLCNLVCSSMGRHAHIDYCRSPDARSCNSPETNHIPARMQPEPERPKDWISHKLYWQRLGFKDPYSREEQANFAKCDSMCSGTEHQARDGNPAQPSYCTLPIFHQPAVLSQAQAGGYVSHDGHLFSCKNPAVLTQAFHVIFAIDRSSSMASRDRRPLQTPVVDRISRVADNRLGAVYSALHSFWQARVAAMNHASIQARRDAYSVVLFNNSAIEILNNDFAKSPDELLDLVLQHSAGGGTNFTATLSLVEQIMTRHWSTERVPIVIFLSDGECTVADNVVYSLCNRAVALGRALSFQSVSFGPDGSSTWLRRMAQIAKEVQDRAPRDPLLPANAQVDSKYSLALDSVNLAETFLGIADSLRKTRGGLIR